MNAILKAIGFNRIEQDDNHLRKYYYYYTWGGMRISKNSWMNPSDELDKVENEFSFDRRVLDKRIQKLQRVNRIILIEELIKLLLYTIVIGGILITGYIMFK